MATPETKSQNTSGSNSLPNNLKVAATTGVKSCSQNSAANSPSQEVAADGASATSQKLKLTRAAPTQPQQWPTATAEEAITARKGAWIVKFAEAADPPKQEMKQALQASGQTSLQMQKMLAPREEQCELQRTFQQLLQQQQQRLPLQWQQQLTMSWSQGYDIPPQQIQNIPPMIMQQLQQNRSLQLWWQQQQQNQLLQQWQQQNQSLHQWRVPQQQQNQSLHQWRVPQQQQNQSLQQCPKQQQQNQFPLQLRMQQQQLRMQQQQLRMRQQQNQLLQQQKHMLLNPKYELEGVPQPQPEQSSKQEQVVVQMPSATQPLLAKPANPLPREDANRTARGRSAVKLEKLMKLPVLGLRKKVALLIVVLTLVAVLSMALMGFPAF